MTAPTLALPSGNPLFWAVSDALQLTKRHLIYYVRLPALVFFSTVQPVMFVLLFRYVFGGAIQTHGTSYVNYLLPGIVVQTAAFGSVSTAIGLAEDLKRGVIDRFRSLPIARSAVLIARLTADTLRNVFVILLMVGVGYLVGWRVQTSVLNLVPLLVVSVLFGLGMCAISAYVGLAIKDPEAVQTFGLVWLFPLTFASSVLVPVASMPGWLQAFAKVNPVSLAADAARALTLGGPAGAKILQTLAWLAILLLVFGPLAVRAYRRAT